MDFEEEVWEAKTKTILNQIGKSNYAEDSDT
jgi:hypothetical protein